LKGAENGKRTMLQADMRSASFRWLPAAIIKKTAHALLITLSLILTSCGSVPFDYPKTPSSAIPLSGEGRLGQTALQWQQQHGENSGFIALPNGIDALGARLRMMEVAESSIDAQYFLLKMDRVGTLFTGKMLRAADRGVRVRLLFDDIFTPSADQALSLLNAHRNIEVRSFNPLSRQSFKTWGFLRDFKRANRRMHNKSFTVDNSMAIVGGRNIGEEYFELKQDVKFDDFEVIAIGPVVEKVSEGFDAFWNSELSVPMEAFDVAVDPEDLDKWRESIRIRVQESEQGIYAQAVNSSLLRNIREQNIQPKVARAAMVTDSPDKLLRRTGKKELATLAMEMRRRFLAAQREIVIITPYFIPQKRGAKLIEELLTKGVHVIVITNSLASTNHVPVHSGYARYRKRLLKAGVELYEIRVDAVGDENEWGLKPEMVTLHSKATIIDRKTIFVGSLNFDPRSLLINTEMGLFIESTEIGSQLRQLLAKELPRVAYKVELDERGKLRWRHEHNGEQEVLDREPQASWGRRFKARLYRLLPIESQL